MTTASVDVPASIQPRSLNDMSCDEQEQFLGSLRERRLRAAKVYAKARADAEELSDDKARDQMLKLCNMLERNFEAIDKQITTAEQRIQKLRVLRLHFGLD